MHMYTTDFLNVMDEHTTAVSDTVSLDLTYFSNKFIESGFITQTAASEVLSKLGVSAGDKSRELLHLARQNYKTSLKKPLNIQLTRWPGGEESVHTCPRHLDHTEPQSPDISLHPDDHPCSKRYTACTLIVMLVGRLERRYIFGMHVRGLSAHVQLMNYDHHKLALSHILTGKCNRLNSTYILIFHSSQSC